MEKCNYGNVTFLPDGVHELDPCQYREISRLRNVTISILKCEKCGHIEIAWERQENTEEIDETD